MASTILGAIANPQIADIAGALDYRQKKLDDDEAKRKAIRVNQLAGQALSSGLEPGSVMHSLATENPQGYLAISKSMGIDPSDGAGVHQMTVDANTINKLANAGDIAGAINYMQTEAERRKSLGIKADYLDRGLQAVQANPHQFFNGVALLDQSFNPAQAKEGYTLNEGDRRFNAKNELVASGAPKRDPDGPDRTTAEQKNWQEYQRLVAAGDPGAEAFGRAARFESSEGQKLSPFAEKEIASASDEYTTATSAMSRYKSLADKLKGSAMGGGLTSKWTEFVKEQTGNQDELTALRKEALGITNSEAINSLPPGPATDRDIELARAPFPTEKADPVYVANWLGAISRLNEKKAQYAEFKANFIGQNGTTRSKDGKTLVSAWKDSQSEAAKAAPADNGGGWSIKSVGQ